VLEFRNVPKFLAVLLTAAALAACAQSPALTGKTPFVSAGRQASLDDRHAPPTTVHKPVAAATMQLPSATDMHTVVAPGATYGLASYYAEGTETASGERFDPDALTAAHPSLPFGTRVRVTDLATGRSVVVRVNDRGPFVPGRVVDVSYSAAASLGIIERGTAKVKLDVVQ